jgi:hypothetical protein
MLRRTVRPSAQTMMDRITPEELQLRSLNGTDGIQLTIEETLMMQAVWSAAERVDWARYEELRLRVLAWPSPASSDHEERAAVHPIAELAPA